MRGLATVLGLCLVLTCSGIAVAGTIDLTDLSGTGSTGASSRPVYNYDIPAGDCDVIAIAFDYNYGDATNIPFGHAAFRIRRLNDDGTDSWLGSFNIHPGSFNLDTDYGPSVSSGPMPTGVNHYVFTMNRATGEWDLALNGVPGVLVGPTETGGLNFFSDESPEAFQNAIDLGLSNLATDGLGGTGAYRLQFEEAVNGSVGNIRANCVPVPNALLLGGLGLCLVGWLKRRRN